MPARLRNSCLLLLLLIPVLGGCREAGLTRKGDELLVMAPMAKGEIETWQKVLDQAAGKAKLKIALVPDADRAHYYQRLRQIMGTKQGPDVAVIEWRYLPEFAARGQLKDLRSYFAGQKELMVGDYYPAAWKAGFYGGSMVGLPDEVDAVALAFNHNLADLAALPIPTGPLSWAEYRKAAKSMARDTDDPHTAVYGAAIADWWEIFAWQNGGEIVDNSADPKRSTLSDPKTQQALQFLADMVLVDKTTAPPASTGVADPATLFHAGRLGMIFSQRRDLTQLTDNVDFSGAAADAPRGAKPANIQLGSSFCISRACAQSDKAWQLIAYLAGDEGQQALAQGGLTLPARSAVTESTVFLESSRGGAVAFLDGLKVAHPLPVTPHWAEMETIYRRELARLWLGQATVAQVCQTIDDQVNRLLAQPQPARALLGPLLPAPATG
jgi:ABC-type glycerol-3-phosphate transport system substrate-binding protein